MSISDYYENAILDHMVRGQAFTPPTVVYLSLHTADPGDTGSPSNEVTNTGGSTYARVGIGTGQSFTFAAAASGQMTLSSGTPEFGGANGMPAATVTHLGIYDASTSGNLLWSGALATARTVAAGDYLRFTAVTLSLD